MGAEYLFYMKSIEAHTCAFLALIILGIGTVVSLIIQFILFQKEDITIRLQLLHLHQIRVFMKPIFGGPFCSYITFKITETEQTI